MTSQSPQDETLTDAYVDGWLAVNQLVREGGSWSGREANCTHLNLGDGTFADVSRLSGLGFKDDGRAFATSDWDDDGDLDLWVVNRTAPQVRFLRNDHGMLPGSDDKTFLELRLTGTSSNRDAIGTRVDAFAGDRRMTRLVQAGAGFISQSSKRVHFGMDGDIAALDELVVRWPDGQVERFEGVATGKRYALIQGQGELTDVVAASRGVSLSPSTLIPETKTEVARIGLSWRVPFPDLTLSDFEGGTHATTGSPLLVNLWGSWCPSCRVELHDWNAHRVELEGVGLRILALAVDEHDAAAADHPARLLADEMDLWFATGAAPDCLILALDVLQSTLLDRRRRLAVPVSFLLDAKGRIAFIYKGPVDLDTLLKDVAATELPGLEAARASLPFPGRWYQGPNFPGVLALADKLAGEGLDDLAAGYVAFAAEASVGLDRDSAGRRQVAASLLRIGLRLFAEGQHAEAAGPLRQALEADPDLVASWFALGRIAHDAGDMAEAEASLRRAIEVAAEHADSWHLLGVVLLSGGRHAEALNALERAVVCDPTHGAAWMALGIAHLVAGQFEAGGPAFEQAVVFEPANAAAWTGLATCRARTGDRAGARTAVKRALLLDPGDPRAIALEQSLAPDG